MLETTINAQTNNFLSERNLAELIKKPKFDKTYICQIFNLYTDVPLQDLVRFIDDHNISEYDFMTYYKLYVKSYFSSLELEEAFSHVG